MSIACQCELCRARRDSLSESSTCCTYRCYYFLTTNYTLAVDVLIYWV
nr:MAG TPA: hypothetical protein [Caudoviricetes sp.]